MSMAIKNAKSFQIDERVVLDDETCRMGIEGERVTTENGKMVSFCVFVLLKCILAL